MNIGKAKIDDLNGRLTISIPSKKDRVLLIFGTVWLVGWFFGVINSISTFGYGSSGNFSIDNLMNSWFIAWTSFGLGLMLCILWGYFGKEILRIESNTMDFEKSIFGVGLKKNLVQDEIKNIRFEKINENSTSSGNRWAFWGLGPGKIKFDYGLKKYSLGLSLNDEEAIFLTNLLKEKIEKTAIHRKEY